MTTSFLQRPGYLKPHKTPEAWKCKVTKFMQINITKALQIVKCSKKDENSCILFSQLLVKVKLIVKSGS